MRLLMRLPTLLGNLAYGLLGAASMLVFLQPIASREQARLYGVAEITAIDSYGLGCLEGGGHSPRSIKHCKAATAAFDEHISSYVEIKGYLMRKRK